MADSTPYNRNRRARTSLVAALALFPVVTVLGADIPLRTAVVFNTACAQCHEGECSGRLSFDLGRQAAASHIHRYVGEVSADMQQDLFTLLADMKRSCAYHPLAVEVPRNGIWRRELLAQLRSPTGAAYFIPLGMLAAGRYQARLTFDTTVEADAQVISDAFDISDHPGLRTEGSRADFIFSLERKSANHLRLQTGKPATLIELQITPLP